MTLELQGLIGIGGAGIIMALVNIVKAWVTDTRWYPPISIAFGIALNFAVRFMMGDLAGGITSTVLLGVISGLAASGLYTGTNAIGEKPPTN